MTDLTHDTILAMEAGPELDALVGETVMEWELLDRVHAGWGTGPPVFGTNDPERPTIQGWSPSTDIAAAWEVVDKCLSNGWHMKIWPSKGQHWHVDAHCPKRGPVAGSPCVGTWATAVPLAICRTALLIKHQSQEQPT